ncbi:MAG: hypothetical protein HS113_07795 [Verrucomicrobiales bacterium]|nr:hypothetical protein [Verrucomicrobiales bacterium]
MARPRRIDVDLAAKAREAPPAQDLQQLRMAQAVLLPSPAQLQNKPPRLWASAGHGRPVADAPAL